MSANYADQLRKSEYFGWHVYAVHEVGGEFSKVGTASTPAYRIAGLQNGNPRRLAVVGIWHLDSRDLAFEVEKIALLHLGNDRVPGRDWVRCGPEQAREAVVDAIDQLGIKYTVIE